MSRLPHSSSSQPLCGVCRSKAPQDSRRRLPIAVPLRRDVADLLLGVFHDARLVHHVPVPEGDELLQVVGQELAADVDAEPQGRNSEPAGESRAVRGGAKPRRAGRARACAGREKQDSPLDGVGHDAAAQDGHDMGEAEPGIDHEGAFRDGRLGRSSRFEAVGYQGRSFPSRHESAAGRWARGRKVPRELTWTSQVACKVVLFKDDLVVVFLHVREVQNGFGHEQVGLGRVDLQPGRVRRGGDQLPAASTEKQLVDSPGTLCPFRPTPDPTRSSARPNCSGYRARRGRGRSSRQSRDSRGRVRRRQSCAERLCSARCRSGTS